jgi:hypothetical protein
VYRETLGTLVSRLGLHSHSKVDAVGSGLFGVGNILNLLPGVDARQWRFVGPRIGQRGAAGVIVIASSRTV